jgi:transposase
VVIDAVEVDESDDSIVVSCRLCERRSGRYDQGEGRRRWRALDAGTTKVFIEADGPRVNCRDHGVTVAWVPWARHTRDFDDQVAWLVTHTSKTAVVELMRIAGPFDGLERIGIDEISYRRGHKYLMVVVDHDTVRCV